jgi:hypothetical protein
LPAGIEEFKRDFQDEIRALVDQGGLNIITQDVTDLCGESHRESGLPKVSRSDWFEPAERKYWLDLRSLVEITSTRQLNGETSLPFHPWNRRGVPPID